MVPANERLPSGGIGTSDKAGSALRALAITSPTLRGASGSGSNTATSHPFNRNRAAQPPPITPPPMIAAFRAMSFPFQAGAPPRTPAFPHRGRQRAVFISCAARSQDPAPFVAGQKAGWPCSSTQGPTFWPPSARVSKQPTSGVTGEPLRGPAMQGQSASQLATYLSAAAAPAFPASASPALRPG